MNYPHLIILYGKFSDKLHEKQQAMISGRSTCGYRHYAERFGEIVYLSPQRTIERWDTWINDPVKLETYLKSKPGAIIWSVKHDPTGKKDEIIRYLPNKKVYYSCCSYNMYNHHCDISLVDTAERVRGNGRLWVKGKDPEYWKPVHSVKLVDYLFIGKRGDKNEAYFINRLTKEVKAERSILWVGGEKHRKSIKPSHHRIITTPFHSMEEVRDLICTARIGIILSEIPAEGYPQTFLEMSMIGLPVVYMGPYNKVYNTNCVQIEDKRDSVNTAEYLLKNYPPKWDYRKYAIRHYSLEKSYDSILKGLK